MVLSGAILDRKRASYFAITLILFGSIIVSCGTEDKGKPDIVIEDGQLGYEEFGLKKGSEYHWKIVAKDDQQPG